MSSRNFSTMADGNHQDYNSATLSLYRLTGVAGLLLQKGKNVLANHMPFSDRRTQELGDLIAKMWEGYKTVNRRVRQVLVSYDAGSLLVVCQDDARIALLLTPRAEMDMVSSAATVFLSEHADKMAFLPSERVTNEIRDPMAQKDAGGNGAKNATNGTKPAAEGEKEKAPPSRWPEVRKALESILSKVMGRAQVANLIERTSREKDEKADLSKLTTEAGKELALLVVDQVPNRAKRASLRMELEGAFEDLKL